jgi:hypothetical protein
MKIKSFLLLFLFSFISISLLAQEDNGGMANLLRSNGRIYVVVAVVVLILVRAYFISCKIRQKNNQA